MATTDVNVALAARRVEVLAADVELLALLDAVLQDEGNGGASGVSVDGAAGRKWARERDSLGGLVLDLLVIAKEGRLGLLL